MHRRGYDVLAHSMSIEVKAERTMLVAKREFERFLHGDPIEWPAVLPKAKLAVGQRILVQVSH